MTDLKTTFPRLHYALEEMCLDNGLQMRDAVSLPSNWVDKARLAEAELLKLSDEDIQTLVAGEETDQNEIAAVAPVAYEIVCVAFDGSLGVSVYDHE